MWNHGVISPVTTDMIYMKRACVKQLYTAMFVSKVHDWASLAIPQMSLKKPEHAQMCPGVNKAKTAAATAMFESKVYDWASLAISQTSLKKPKHAQMYPGVTKAKTAAVMFGGHKWMSLCVPY